MHLFLLFSWHLNTSDNTQCHAVGDFLTKHNLTDVHNLIVLISVDSLLRCEW
jgi:hypothetical protein